MVRATRRVAGTILASSLLLAACGQRGPLYLPRPPAPPPPAAATTAPVPSPTATPTPATPPIPDGTRDLPK